MAYSRSLVERIRHVVSVHKPTAGSGERKMNLRNMFPNARYSSPATERLIAEAQRALGVTLPEELRNFYLQCDGFREDRGNAKYLFSLLDEDTIGSLVTITRYFWQQVSVPDLSAFVFFGSSGGGEFWGISLQKPLEIIAYHHNMEDQFEVVGSRIQDVWESDYALYDEVDQ